MSESSSDIVRQRSGAFALGCTACGLQHEPSVNHVRCQRCASTLVIQYLEGANGRNYPLPAINLGQGDTPSIELAATCERLGLAKLTAKLEFMSPTGSFKDRGSAFVVAAAVEESISQFVEDSSGNAGASMAAYAAAAGIKAHIFAPSSAAAGKLDQIQVFGAQLHAIDGPRQAATDAAVGYATNRGIPYLSHALSPWFIEGMKSFAREVIDCGDLPTDIVLPVGNGSLLLSTESVFREEWSEGRGHARPPRIHAVQSDAVHPLATKFNGATDDQANAKGPTTVASGIAVTSPPRLAEMCQAIRRSRGSVITVDDAAILDWQRYLAATEGIFCEATSAAAFAGLRQLIANGAIGTEARVLIPVTGSGLKEPLASN